MTSSPSPTNGLSSSLPSTSTAPVNVVRSASSSLPGVFPAGPYTFRSDFDSGRLGTVRYEPGESVYNLWLPADGEENMELYVRYQQQQQQHQQQVFLQQQQQKRNNMYSTNDPSTKINIPNGEPLLSSPSSSSSSSSYPTITQSPLINDEYRVWYLFAITNGVPGTTIRLRIMNMNVIAKVYNSDLRPLVRVPSLSPLWERIHQSSSFAITGGGNLELQITWDYTFVSSAPVYFAFYYPFSYTDCQRLLDNIDRVMINLSTHGTALLGHQTISVPSPLFTAPLPNGSVPAPKKMIIASSSGYASNNNTMNGKGASSIVLNDDNIYYHRELLCYSPDSRRVELLTISSCHGIMNERELPLDDTSSPSSFSSSLRPHKFKGKPGVFLSARVHPGETASSYMLHGFLAFLLQPRNPHAKALRTSFVFKIVPMINPDGVARGYFRTDQFGINLNRAYVSPSLTYQPAIAGIKLVLRQMAATLSPVTLPQEGRTLRALHNSQNGLYIYIDLHGFTGRDGCYIIGNALPSHKEARCRTFTHLLQLYAPQFNAFACSFGSAHARKRANRADPSFNVSSTINTVTGNNQRENILENLRRKLKIDTIDNSNGSNSTNGGSNNGGIVHTLLAGTGVKGNTVGIASTKYTRQRIQPVDVTSLAYAVSLLTGNENSKGTDNRGSNGNESATKSSSTDMKISTVKNNPIPSTDYSASDNDKLTNDITVPKNKNGNDNDDDNSIDIYRDDNDEEDTDTDMDSLDGDGDEEDSDEDSGDGDEDSSDDDSSTGKVRKKHTWILPPGTLRWSKTMNKEKLLAAQIQSLQYFSLPIPSLVPPNPTPSLSSIILGRINNNTMAVTNSSVPGKTPPSAPPPSVTTLPPTASYGLPSPPPVPKYDIPSRVDATNNAKKEMVVGIAADGTRYAVASSSSSNNKSPGNLSNPSTSPNRTVSTNSSSPNRTFLNLSAVRSVSPLLSPSSSPSKTLTNLPSLMDTLTAKPTASPLPLSRNGMGISILPLYSNLLGSVTKVPSCIRVMDPTILYPPILPEGSRWGPAYSLLHELEARKVQKEWNATKSRPIGSRMNPGSTYSSSNFPNIFFPSASTTNTFTYGNEPLSKENVIGTSTNDTSLASNNPLLGSTAVYATNIPTSSSLPSVSTNDIGKENKKGGTGRARVYREFGVIHSYTVECSCNLLSHTNVLHRSLQFTNPSVSSSLYTKQQLAGGLPDSSSSSLPYLQNNRFVSSLGLSNDPSVNQTSVIDIHKYTLAHSKTYAVPVNASIHGQDASFGAISNTVPYTLIDCPIHSLPYRSQIDPRYTTSDASSTTTGKAKDTVDSSSAVPPLPSTFFLCQIDSLQPPPASTKSTNYSLNSSKDILNVSQLNFHSPFGITSHLPLPYDTCTCTWGTCPNDPPSVFAMVGRALAYTIVEFIGITQGKENLGSSLQQHHTVLNNVTVHRPLNLNTLIPSRLTSTVFRNMNGIHKFSRIISGAEQLNREELWKLYSTYYQSGWTSIVAPSVLGGSTANAGNNTTSIQSNTNTNNNSSVTNNSLMNGKGGFAAISAALATRAQSLATASASIVSGSTSFLSDAATTVATIINSEPDLILGSLLLNDRPQIIDSVVYPLPLQSQSIPFMPYQKHSSNPLNDTIITNTKPSLPKTNTLSSVVSTTVIAATATTSVTVPPSHQGTSSRDSTKDKGLIPLNMTRDEYTSNTPTVSNSIVSIPRPTTLTRSLSSNDQYTSTTSTVSLTDTNATMKIMIPSSSTLPSSLLRPPSSSYRPGKTVKSILRPKSASLYPPDFPTSPLVVLAQPVQNPANDRSTGLPSSLVINNQRQIVQLPSQRNRYTNHFNPSTRTTAKYSPRSPNQ